jgi:nitric oxide reductase NorD protein
MTAHDGTLLAGVLQPKLARFKASHAAAEVATVLHWLQVLNEEDPVCALAVAERLEHLLERLGADGLGRWILAGQRRHAADVSLQRTWFRLEDPGAVAALHSEAGAESLQHALPSLGLFASGLTGIDLRVEVRQQTQLNVPPMRPVLTRTHLLLPDDYTVLDDRGDRERLYRAAIAHATAHLRYSAPGRPAHSLKPLGIAVVSAIEDARVEHLLLRDFPGALRWFVESLPTLPDASDLGFAALIARMDRALLDHAYEDDNHWVNKARRLFNETVATVGLTDYSAFRSVASILANDLGQMRVRFNPLQYVVPAAYRDDNSYLWDLGDGQVPAEEAMALQHTGARPPPDAAQPAADDGALAERGGEMETGRFSYPEWDQRLERLRHDWCTVIEKMPAWQGLASQDPTTRGWTSAALALPRSRRVSRTRRLRRQWEGDDVDLNAAIEVLVDRRLHLQPEPRLFMRAGKELHFASILVLLDLSESANDRVGGAALSLLDIEKQAALLVASMGHGGDRIAIHGFSSNTRAEVYYYRLLEFGAPLGPTSRAMIGSVRARYSTRMGAALRHATVQLREEPTGQRAILLVTDGAPSDVDVTEPDYLIEDARMAVLEARQAGVQTYCIAVDAAADRYVRRIFGWRNYGIADDPQSLPVHLQRVRTRLAAN